MGEHKTAPARQPVDPRYQAAAETVDQAVVAMIAVARERGYDPGAITAGIVAALVRHVANTMVAPVTAKRIYGVVMASVPSAANQEVAARKPPPPAHLQN